MLRFVIAFPLKTTIALVLVILAAVQLPAQEILQNQPSCQTEPSAAVPTLSPEIEALIRRYTSTVDLKEGDRSLGKIRMVWLHPALVDAIIDEYGTQKRLSPIALARIKRAVHLKLKGPHYMPFLLLFQPDSETRIGRPDWIPSSDGRKYYPSVLLRGSAGHSAGPYIYYKALGHGETQKFFFTQPSHAYVIYRAERNDGRSFIQKNDLSFAVDYQGTVGIGDKDYKLEAEFEYDLMPIPMHELIDSKITSWNQGWATLTLKPPENLEVSRYHYPAIQQESAPVPVPQFYTQASATSMSRSEIIGVVGLLIGFAQLVVMVAAL